LSNPSTSVRIPKFGPLLSFVALVQENAMSRPELPHASRERLRRLKHALRDAGLAAYLATGPVEVSYLSNFGGDDSFLFRYGEDAATDCPHLATRLRKRSLVDEVVRLAKRRGTPVAVNPDQVTLSLRRQLVQHLGAGGLKELPNIVTEMRACKDATEIAAIEQALAITEAAYGDFLKRIRLGLTETRLAAELEYAMRCHGAAGAAFPTICAIGPNASRPHARPGNRRLAADTPLLIDFGVLWGGYRCDLTRMVFLARIRPEVRRAYEAVLEAQEAAIAVAGPGVRAVDVDSAARDVLTCYGYGKAFGHGTGHGLGREVHEAPTVSQRAGDTVLQPGMVVTVEPGVYIPGRFGIRIEDDVLITRTGRRVLSHLPKKLDDVQLTGHRR
jgi:Xaa-Pro aminopeptidase